VLICRSNNCARAEVPPNRSMISDAFMASTLALSASHSQESIANSFSASCDSMRHKARVLGSKEILDELARRGIEKAEIAQVLGIHPSQVTRLYAEEDKPRHLKHDEAVKLVAKYGLEPSVPPLPPPVWRLIARHIAARLALPLREDDPRLQELVGDLAGFSRFVRNRQVQGLLRASENYFDAMQSRQELESAGQLEIDPQHAR
jgi:hypothetical protein